MSQRKRQKEIDKATANLMKYGEQTPWSERQTEFFSDMLMDAADRVDVPVDELGQTLEDHGYMGMVFGYLFELFATSVWDDDEVNMIEDYVKRRGWREAPYAKRYLTALSQSDIGLWEVVTVNAGQWLELRPVGTTEKAIRIHERSGSQSLKRWDCIAARVLSLDGKYSLSGGILPFSPEQAQEVPALLNQTFQIVTDNLKEIRAEDGELSWSDEDIEQTARAEANEQLPELLIIFWICQSWLALNKPLPTIMNRDGHLLQLSKVKFPVNTKNQNDIESRLNASPQLDFNDHTKEWVWLNCARDVIEHGGSIALGHLSMADDYLTAIVNSVERAEEIKAYLSDLLGESIGPPLSVHENFQSAMEDYAEKEGQPAEPLDVPELITASLNQHYQKVLDEPLPALNNLSPRQCAAERDQHAALMHWLKGLENFTASAPHMAHYDFKWMWEELGLAYPVADD